MLNTPTIESNNHPTLSSDQIELGKQLCEAFHHKDEKQICECIEKGAPVNYRLSYGLEVRLEAHFVAQLYLLLGGDESLSLIDNEAMNKLYEGNLCPDIAEGKLDKTSLKNYIQNALVILKMVESPEANQAIIPLNPEYCTHVLEHAVGFRANPDARNGALIIAAGLRDPKLVSELIEKGRKAVTISADDNGARVNFKGFFDDNAAVWSTILLDSDTLNLLLQHGSQTTGIGLTQSSLLHWAVCAHRMGSYLENSAYQENALTIAKLLIKHDDTQLMQKNKCGKRPIDYACDEMKRYLASIIPRGSIGALEANGTFSDLAKTHETTTNPQKFQSSLSK